jgi:hypothetical protein
VKTCDDCATCARRPELARGLGRTTGEVAVLAQPCQTCGHRLHRHLHGLVRTSQVTSAVADVRHAVEPPPRESPLGRLDR